MAVVPYESTVSVSFDRLLGEAGAFFMDRGDVKDTLRRLARDLDEAGIPYALVGALALGRHGMPRLTVDIDLLLTREGLDAFRSRYEGRGYVPAFPGAAKSFRAADTGVRIDVITTGEYPGDGKPKPVRFPDPSEASVEIDGIRVVRLERFVELKLASGMTASHRMRDLADIQDLIRNVTLPLEFGDRLDPSVRETYRDLWRKSQTVDPIAGL